MTRLQILLSLFFAAPLVGAASTASSDEPAVDSPAARYRSELADLHVRRTYTPGKNSFVLGLETHAQRDRILGIGDRKTLLDAEGPGSLRHIWQTHGPGESPFVLEFFVDGEEAPSIRGRLSDLIRAAQNTQQSLVLNPGGFIAEGSNNLYLPVPFDESLRVDLVVTEDYRFIFTQLDFRTDDDSLQGVRLVQEGEGQDLQLRYEGLPPTTPESSTSGSTATKSAAEALRRERALLVGDGRLELEGPGIIRRLGVNAVRPGVRLKIFFDGATEAAVDADLADFFGPFRGTVLNNNQSFFPMPFGESAVVQIEGAGPSEELRIEADVESVDRFEAEWRYFHARSSPPQTTDGALPFQILYTRGAGHWVGMSLYGSGMDHGGGDFAVVDGESDDPHFLHGINGEDYFSFAFFGRGENFPYSEAFDNDTGRMRLHLENPYPFEESLQLSFGVLKDLEPRAVAYWYQDTPAGAALGLEESKGLSWEVFGPVDAPVEEDGNTLAASNPGDLFAPLPDPKQLDAGETVEARHLMFEQTFTGSFVGWASQPAIGPHLNLSYVYGHVTDLGGHHHMGYYPRLMMAQTKLTNDREREVTLQLSYDDPIWIHLNGEEVIADLESHRGFITRTVPVKLAEGQNTLLVRIADLPNVTMVWAGLNLRLLDASGRDISRELQPAREEASRDPE